MTIQPRHNSCAAQSMEDLLCGVVITFGEIKAAKALEAELREEIVRLK